MYACMLARSVVFVTPWTVPCQASLSMKFSRQESWSGCLLHLLHWQVNSLLLHHWEAMLCVFYYNFWKMFTVEDRNSSLSDDNNNKKS